MGIGDRGPRRRRSLVFSRRDGLVSAVVEGVGFGHRRWCFGVLATASSAAGVRAGFGACCGGGRRDLLGLG